MALWFDKKNMIKKQQAAKQSVIKGTEVRNDEEKKQKEYIDSLVKAYTEGHPLVSDEEYDVILEEYLRKYGEDKRPFTRRAQSSAVNDIVGTLTKVYGVESPMREGQKVYKDWLFKHPNVKRVLVQYKYDGCSIACDCNTNQFFTRGDYDNGESVEITNAVQNTSENCIVKNGAYSNCDAVKYECIMPRRSFACCGAGYLRPRDYVSASITLQNPERFDNVYFKLLRLYANNKMYVPENIGETFDADDFEGIQGFINKLLTNGCLHNDLECDGVVVSPIDETDVISLFRNDTAYRINGDEVAIKIIKDIKETILEDISFEFGKTGRITPVAKLKPVKFGNITVTNVTLSTISRCYGLYKGQTVEIMYNIVPYFVGPTVSDVYNNHYREDVEYFQPPTHCPHCNSILHWVSDTRDDSILACTNRECPGYKLGSIVRYAQSMKIFGVSEAVITRLYESEIVHSIPDLYKMNVNEIARLKGFGEVSANKIIKSIKSSSKNVKFTRFLGSFPIDNWSAGRWTALFDHSKLSGMDLLKMEPDELKRYILAHPVPCLGETMLENLIEGYTRNRNDMIEISKYIEFEHQITTETKGVVTFTGDHNKEIVRLAEAKGYAVRPMTNSTTILVIKDITYKSDKVDKAIRLGIPIYTMEDFRNKLLSE